MAQKCRFSQGNPTKCGRVPPLLHAEFAEGSVGSAMCSFDQSTSVDGGGSVSCDLQCGSGYHLNETALTVQGVLYPAVLITEYKCLCAGFVPPGCGWQNGFQSISPRVMQCLED